MDHHNERSDFNPEDTPSFEEIREQLRVLRDQVVANVNPGQLNSSQINALIEHLPRLTEQDLIDLGHQESLCSICFNPYLAILAEEEMATAMDSPALAVEDIGVTRLSKPWQCGHIFCRRDISKWIQEAHDSCPMCRRLLIEPNTSTIPQNVQTNTNESLAEFEQYMESFIDILRSRVGDAQPSVAQMTTLSEVEDRSDFSRMYS